MWPPRKRCENCAYGFVDKIRNMLVRCGNKDYIQRDRKSNADFVFEKLEKEDNFMQDKKLLYYVVPKESFEAEGRIFLKGEKYPVYDNDGFSIVCAENGEFNFANHLMGRVIREWDLDVLEV